MRFNKNTLEHLAHYVYGLIDPRDNRIFYVGKASANNRAFDHFKESTNEKKKHQKITEIKAAGFHPDVEILRYGLESEKASFEVEAAIIDALGMENLTNLVRGHGVDRGRQSWREIERLHGSLPQAIEEISQKYMLFFIKNTYSPTKTELELYDCVRQFWSNVSLASRTKVDGVLPYPIALAIVDSVIVRAYKILDWYPAGSTISSRKSKNIENRWEFVGQLISSDIGMVNEVQESRQSDVGEEVTNSTDMYGHVRKILGRRLTKEGRDVPANQLGFGYIN